MKRSVRRTVIFSILVFIVTAVIIWVIWANTALELNMITVQEDNLPENFDGFRIAHVSDLHSAEMGEENGQLLAMLRQAEPDIIAITGDLADSRDTDISVALNFAAEAVKIAPCYYITGNHEVRLKGTLYNQLMDGLSAAGVTVLADEEVILTREGQSISVAGHAWGVTDHIDEISDFEGYRILLSHAPEDFDDYAEAGFDLVLCGHAHGGQFRLPFVGGLYAPGQGFFPEYDSGLYTLGNSNMIVSRGIGNSNIPIRINNRPEVILVVLEG